MTDSQADVEANAAMGSQLIQTVMHNLYAHVQSLDGPLCFGSVSMHTPDFPPHSCNEACSPPGYYIHCVDIMSCKFAPFKQFHQAACILKLRQHTGFLKRSACFSTCAHRCGGRQPDNDQQRRLCGWACAADGRLDHSCYCCATHSSSRRISCGSNHGSAPNATSWPCCSCSQCSHGCKHASSSPG